MDKNIEQLELRKKIEKIEKEDTFPIDSVREVQAVHHSNSIFQALNISDFIVENKEKNEFIGQSDQKEDQSKVKFLNCGIRKFKNRIQLSSPYFSSISNQRKIIVLQDEFDCEDYKDPEELQRIVQEDKIRVEQLNNENNCVEYLNTKQRLKRLQSMIKKLQEIYQEELHLKNQRKNQVLNNFNKKVEVINQRIQFLNTVKAKEKERSLQRVHFTFKKKQKKSKFILQDLVSMCLDAFEVVFGFLELSELKGVFLSCFGFNKFIKSRVKCCVLISIPNKARKGSPNFHSFQIRTLEIKRSFSLYLKSILPEKETTKPKDSRVFGTNQNTIRDLVIHSYDLEPFGSVMNQIKEPILLLRNLTRFECFGKKKNLINLKRVFNYSLKHVTILKLLDITIVLEDANFPILKTLEFSFCQSFCSPSFNLITNHDQFNLFFRKFKKINALTKLRFCDHYFGNQVFLKPKYDSDSEYSDESDEHDEDDRIFKLRRLFDNGTKLLKLHFLKLLEYIKEKNSLREIKIVYFWKPEKVDVEEEEKYSLAIENSIFQIMKECKLEKFLVNIRKKRVGDVKYGDYPNNPNQEIFSFLFKLAQTKKSKTLKTIQIGAEPIYISKYQEGEDDSLRMDYLLITHLVQMQGINLKVRSFPHRFKNSYYLSFQNNISKLESFSLCRRHLKKKQYLLSLVLKLGVKRIEINTKDIFVDLEEKQEFKNSKIEVITINWISSDQKDTKAIQNEKPLNSLINLIKLNKESLKEIRLNQINIKENELVSILEALKTNQYLKKLQISENEENKNQQKIDEILKKEEKPSFPHPRKRLKISEN